VRTSNPTSFSFVLFHLHLNVVNSKSSFSGKMVGSAGEIQLAVNVLADDSGKLVF
jgi:hypothetical protein